MRVPPTMITDWPVATMERRAGGTGETRLAAQDVLWSQETEIDDARAPGERRHFPCFLAFSSADSR